MPTPKFIESGGSATQDLLLYSTTSGNVAIDTSADFTDGRAINLSTNPVTDSFVSKQGVIGEAGRRISIRIKFDTLPAPGSDGQIISAEGPVFNGFQLGIATGGQLEIRGDGIATLQGNSILKVNTVYQICMCFVVNSVSSFQCAAYINGHREIAVSTGTLNGTVLADLYISNRFDLSGSNTTNFWFWDVFIDDGSDCSYPGNIKVTAKRPTANGDLNDFTTQIGSGGSGYGTGHAPQVNELPNSLTNGWAKVGAGDVTYEDYIIESISIGNYDMSANRVVGVIGWVYAKSLAPESALIRVNGSGTFISLTSTPTVFTYIAAAFTLYPNGGDAIGLRASTDLTTVSLYECGIMVAFVPADLTVRIDDPTLGSSIF